MMILEFLHDFASNLGVRFCSRLFCVGFGSEQMWFRAAFQHGGLRARVTHEIGYMRAVTESSLRIDARRQILDESAIAGLHRRRALLYKKRENADRSVGTADAIYEARRAYGNPDHKNRQNVESGIATGTGDAPEVAGAGVIAFQRLSPSLSHPGDSFWMNPFSLMRRMPEEPDSVFGESNEGEQRERTWTSAVELMQREGNLVARAELPGLKPEDVRL